MRPNIAEIIGERPLCRYCKKKAGKLYLGYEIRGQEGEEYVSDV